LETFDFITKQTNTFLTELKDFVDAPDLVYDFFGMGLRFLRYNKDIMFRST
jgi:hypothetical protein